MSSKTGERKNSPAASPLDWLSLARTPGLGPAGAKRLLENMGGIAPVLAADAKALQGKGGLRAELAKSLAERRGRRAAEKELRLAGKHQLHCIAFDHPCYPVLLKELNDPPLMLYGKGRLKALSRPMLAVVGARSASIYGKRIAARIAAELASAGLNIVSGGALGIDSAAHSGVLAQNQASTIAVLGCGIDIAYPPQNKKLFAAICEQGLLISEYPPNTQPEPFRFPARNRIISGMALGCLVVEAARKSGSLITAEMAMEQGKEVFAVPGSIDSNKSEGCHRLIQDGATLVRGSDDIIKSLATNPILASLGLREGAGGNAKGEDGEDGANGKEAENSGQASDNILGSPLNPVSPQEARLLAVLDIYPQGIERIIKNSALTAGEVNALLMSLEMKGRVESAPGQQYSLKGKGVKG